MQKDFHYDVLYLLALKAGFSDKNSYTIAYSSQYVDDAKNSGAIFFHDYSIYTRISSAHSPAEIRNLKEELNHLVWIPFHFLPGNCGFPIGAANGKPFVERLVCCPDSYIAREMVMQSIIAKGKPESLHRLGIALHTYADTWAHRGFAGIIHEGINGVSKIEHCSQGDWFLGVKEDVLAELAERIAPLGHGATYAHPDQPFLELWSYNSSYFGRQERRNTDDFIEAADQIFKVLKLYQKGLIGLDNDVSAMFDGVDGLTDDEKQQIRELFISINSGDAEERHNAWISEFTKGKLVPGVYSISPYFSEGADSWKSQALGRDDLSKEAEKEYRYVMTETFINSDWKKFHDALQAQRFFVVNQLLRKYGLIVA